MKIVDFGLSATVPNVQYNKEGEYLNQQIGTFFYMSPEILKKRYTVKCDLWALGVILYFLICAEHPFDSDTGNQIEIIRKIIKGEWVMEHPNFDLVSEECRDFLCQLLCPEEERMTA